MPRAATSDNALNSLHRKPLRTRSSAEGWPRANGAVRRCSQVPADWHALQRINVRNAMPSRDGTVAEDNFVRQHCCHWWIFVSGINVSPCAPWLDVLQLQRLLEEGVVVKVPPTSRIDA